MTAILDVLKPALSSALIEALSRSQPVGAAGATDASRVAETAIATAVESVRSDPALEHAANAEPWYRSRVTIGAFLSAVTIVLGSLGLHLRSADHEIVLDLLVALGGVVGPALTLYGRWVATTPIGR